MREDDIQLIVSCSEQLDDLILGHQQEMQQVLANNKHLRTIVVQQQNMLRDNDRQIYELSNTIREQAQTIERLNAEIEQLRKRPLNTFTGDDFKKARNRPAN